jgi:hypothetical protein
MRRRIVAIWSALSLLLLIATAVLWIRSYWVADSLDWNRGDGFIIAISSRGRFGSEQIHFGQQGGSWTFQGHGRQAPFKLPINLPTSGVSGWPRLGILYIGLPSGGFMQGSCIILPAWLMAIGTGLLPAWWLASYRRRLRLKRQQGGELCVSCGYDLRATTERCPECGTPINGMRRKVS